MSTTSASLNSEANATANWKQTLAPYAKPSLPKSMLDLLTSVVPYVLLFAAMYYLIDVSILLVVLLAFPTAGFLVRTYIVFHDCAHGAFLPSKKGNLWLGRLTGLIVFTPYAAWRHSHAMHHATAGDLDRRGSGDVPTLTVAEFAALPKGKQTLYRLFRNPFILFTIGPIFSLLIQPRLIPKQARRRIKNSTHLTNLGVLLLIVGMCFLIGPLEFLLIQGLLLMIGGAAGVWLFYVQHQFEDTYWQSGEAWDYADAALKGSSYLKLPKILQFFSGNIGLHHVHHLSAKIPNYNLQAAHSENEIFSEIPVLTLWEGLKATRLALWDETTNRLLTFAQARPLLAAS